MLEAAAFLGQPKEGEADLYLGEVGKLRQDLRKEGARYRNEGVRRQLKPAEAFAHAGDTISSPRLRNRLAVELQIGEAGRLLEKAEVDGANRTVPVLGDDDLGDPLLLGVGIVDLELLKSGKVGTETVTVSQSGRTCGSAGQLTCSTTDPFSAAKFNIQGSNNQLVNITVPDTVTVSNGAAGSLVGDRTAPASVTLTSSGVPGDDFYIEGSVDLASSTEEGDYTVDFDVTVEY